MTSYLFYLTKYINCVCKVQMFCMCRMWSHRFVTRLSKLINTSLPPECKKNDDLLPVLIENAKKRRKLHYFLAREGCVLVFLASFCNNPWLGESLGGVRGHQECALPWGLSTPPAVPAGVLWWRRINSIERCFLAGSTNRNVLTPDQYHPTLKSLNYFTLSAHDFGHMFGAGDWYALRHVLAPALGILQVF